MRERTGNGEALLLSTGKLGAERVEAVLYLIPERRLAETFFDMSVEEALVFDPRRTRREGDVVVDGQGQAHWQRGDHSDLATQTVNITGFLHVLAIDFD